MYIYIIIIAEDSDTFVSGSGDEYSGSPPPTDLAPVYETYHNKLVIDSHLYGMHYPISCDLFCFLPACNLGQYTSLYAINIIEPVADIISYTHNLYTSPT